MFVITDGKRNDIGTTMEAYARRTSAKRMCSARKRKLSAQMR